MNATSTNPISSGLASEFKSEFMNSKEGMGIKKESKLLLDEKDQPVQELIEVREEPSRIEAIDTERNMETERSKRPIMA
jgi:hypothetical protein